MYRRLQAAGGSRHALVSGRIGREHEGGAGVRSELQIFCKGSAADFKQPDLPFYYVQIGRHISDANVTEWNHIQEVQLRAESEIPNVGMVVSADLALDDGIHISTPDLKRLGRRLADRVCHDLFPRLADYGALKPGPRPVSASGANGLVKVRFIGVT